jgi:Transmembrane secretion effector
MDAVEREQLKTPPSLWQNRDYLLLMGGQTVSTIGTQVSQFAFPLLVLFLTGSPGWAGFSAALVAVPYFFLALPAGAILDRVDRKRVMILCDVGRALILGSIPLAFLLGHMTLVQLCVCALAEGCLYTLFDIAWSSAIPRVVANDQMGQAGAQETVVREIALSAGPALGGVLFGIGQTLPALTDAISYVVSVCSLLLIKGQFQEERNNEQEQVPLTARIRQGLSWINQHRLIRFLAVLACVGNGLDSGVWILFVIIAVRLHTPAWSIGTVFGISGLSGILASLVAERIGASRGQARFTLRHVMLATQWAIVPLLVALLFVSNIVFLGIITTLIIFLSALQGTVQYMFRIPLIPDEVYSRVTSVFRVVGYAGPPLALGLLGLSLQFAGLSFTILATFAVVLLVAVLMSINPELRRVQELKRSGSND